MDFPDATTLCRFRNRLVHAKLDQVLLRRITSQLERQDLKVSGARGAIIDATILQSAARPDRHIDVPDEGDAQIIDSADHEARWVKKGASAFYGYRGYAAVDSEDGYVEHVEVHPANEAEVNKLVGVVDRLAPGVEAILADKGYASQANREALAQRGIGDLIQHKAQRNAPLQQGALGVLLDIRQLAQQRAGTVDDARQPVVGRQQQRCRRGQEERRCQHGGEHGMVGGRIHGPVAGVVCVMMT